MLLREASFRVTAFKLGPKAEAAGYRLVAFDSVGSTNDEALAAAREGAAGDVWFTALQQTKGRGRRGREWKNPHGNMAASLLVRPSCAPEECATLGFVAGVALRRALQDALPQAVTLMGIDGADVQGGGRVALKWPNDVIADGAKLAGILLEALAMPGGETAIVVGIGVNVTSAPTDLPYPAVAAQQFDGSLDAASIHRLLAEHWVDVYALWDQGRGIAAILNEWRQSAAGIGSEVAVNMNGQVLRGTFQAIDDSGRLIIKNDDGTLMPIAAGDVHFGTTASLVGTSTEQRAL